MVKKLMNINSLVAQLTTFFVCGKNSTYKQKDFAYRLVQSSIGHQSLEAMFKLTGYLSADRVLDKLHKISEERVQELITNYNKHLRLPKSVSLAIILQIKSTIETKIIKKLLEQKVESM